MAFGPRPGDAERFRALGDTDSRRLAAYVETQLHPESVSDLALETRLIEADLPTLKKTLPQLWADHWLRFIALRDSRQAAEAREKEGGGAAAGKQPPFAVDHRAMDLNELRTQPARETEIATWLRAVYSERQLQEVMVGFWHDHFNVFAWEGQIAPVFAHYDRDVIRPHAFGNFRELLGAVAKSPAMLFYLDGFVSQSGNPNENYARELFELHTLGAENYLGTREREKVPGFARGEPAGYVDGDVYEASRCFTGWRVQTGKDTQETGEFFYYEPWHDRFQKIVLGRRIKEYQPPMKDGEDVLDRVAFHPGTSRHIARKLCARLISDDPPSSIVERAARVFREERERPDQLRRVLRAILFSEEFRSTYGRKVKRPFEVTVGMLRVLGAEFHPSVPFLNHYQRAGQRLFSWRTPDGYPDSHPRWTGTSPMVERWRMANQIMAGAIDRVRAPVLETLPPGLRRPDEVARFWSERVLGREDAETIRQELADFLAEERNPALPLPEDRLRQRLPAMVALALMSPGFQLR